MLRSGQLCIRQTARRVNPHRTVELKTTVEVEVEEGEALLVVAEENLECNLLVLEDFSRCMLDST